MKKHSTLKHAEPYIWMLPSMVLMCVMIVIPIVTVFRLSMSKISKAGVVKGFNGFENFKTILESPTFIHILVNTLVWTIAVVGISTLLGFILAMVLNQPFKGRKFVRAVVVFPWATSLIIQALVWKYMLNADYGALNVLLVKLGIAHSYINWFATWQSTFAWECWVGIFVTVPFVTFCVLSGLQSIDSSFYEAAEIDGAGFWKKLTRITLPLVRPSLTVSTVLNIIYVFNSFPIIYTITKGAPANRTDTMITYLYMLAFYDNEKGPATALSVIGFVILCLVAGLYMAISMRKEDA